MIFFVALSVCEEGVQYFLYRKIVPSTEMLLTKVQGKRGERISNKQIDVHPQEHLGAFLCVCVLMRPQFFQLQKQDEMKTPGKKITIMITTGK